MANVLWHRGVRFPHLAQKTLSFVIPGSLHQLTSNATHTRNSAMPLVRIAVPQARGSAHRKAISSGIQHALVETFGVPQDDLFQVITEHAPGT